VVLFQEPQRPQGLDARSAPRGIRKLSGGLCVLGDGDCRVGCLRCDRCCSRVIVCLQGRAQVSLDTHLNKKKGAIFRGFVLWLAGQTPWFHRSDRQHRDMREKKSRESCCEDRIQHLAMDACVTDGGNT